MSALLVGYALLHRRSRPDSTTRRAGPRWGSPLRGVYVDHGLNGVVSRPPSTAISRPRAEGAPTAHQSSSSSGVSGSRRARSPPA